MDLYKEPALSRLTTIRKYLSNLPSSSGPARLAFDVFLVELELRKRSVRAQYFDFEDCFSVSISYHTASVALPLVSELATSRATKDSEKYSPLVKASVSLIAAEILLDFGQSSQTQ